MTAETDLLPDPKFGDWLRGIYASERNPLRDGMYVRTIRRTGRFNPGKFYELTDGKGRFWQCPAKSTVRLDVATASKDAETDLLPVPVIRDTVDLEEWRDACVSSATEALRAEVEMLTGCLATANANHETFERRWYLAHDRAERLAEALQIAFRHLDIGSLRVSHKKDLAAIVAALHPTAAQENGRD